MAVGKLRSRILKGLILVFVLCWPVVVHFVLERTEGFGQSLGSKAEKERDVEGKGGVAVEELPEDGVWDLACSSTYLGAWRKEDSLDPITDKYLGSVKLHAEKVVNIEGRDNAVREFGVGDRPSLRFECSEGSISATFSEPIGVDGEPQSMGVWERFDQREAFIHEWSVTKEEYTKEFTTITRFEDGQLQQERTYKPTEKVRFWLTRTKDVRGLITAFHSADSFSIRVKGQENAYVFPLHCAERATSLLVENCG